MNCEFCGSAKNAHYNKNEQKFLCGKHEAQIRVFGTIRERTSRDRNDILVKKNFAEMIMRDWKTQEEKARTKIDLEDVVRVKDLKWHLDAYGYVMGPTVKGVVKKKHIRLSRYLINAPQESEVDHINGDVLDNRKSNLRLANRSQNTRNVSVHKDNKLGKKGIHKVGSKYRALIYVNKSSLHLGYFSNIESATNARRIAEEKYFGEYARNRR